MVKNQLQLFATQRFFPLFIAQFFSIFNDSCFKFALITYITLNVFASEPQSALLWVNLIGGLYSLPFFLFSATAGKFADKFDRVYLARWIKFFEVVFMLLGVISFYTNNLYFMVIVLFLLGTHSAIFGPIKYSLIPALLPSDELLSGNALMEAGKISAVLLGSILAIHQSNTLPGALLVCVIGLGFSILSLWSSFFIPRVAIGDSSLKLNWNFLRDIPPVIRSAFKEKAAILPLLAIAWLVFSMVAIIRQIPIFAKMVGGDQKLIGLLYAMCVLGIIAGALLCNRLLKGKIQTTFTPFALLIMGLATLDLARTTLPITQKLIPGLYPAKEFLALGVGKHICIDLFILCAAAATYIIPLYSLLQVATLPEKRGRIFACNNILASLAGLIAAFMVIGLLQIHFVTAQVFLTIGLLNFLILPILWKKTRV